MKLRAAHCCAAWPSRASRSCLVFALLVACGGPQHEANEPVTAKQKQLQEAKANGELDGSRKKWGGWRYQGDRDSCFYVVGRKCFRSKKVACSAARCTPGACEIIGGGPATVQCKRKS
jgi:hypothetical protein